MNSTNRLNANDVETLRNPYVFVVGCPRSGTTLLQRMLDNHPLLTVSNDTHFIPRVLGAFGLGSNPAVTPELVEAVQSYHRFPRLGVSGDVVEKVASEAQTYSELVAGLYDEVARLRGKRLAGEKTPDYCRSIPLLHELFPRARFIHIIRDGRDVALSALEWANSKKGPGRLALWAEEPVAVCALWWQSMVSAGRTGGALLGRGLYLEVAYEGLVASPRQELERIVRFLDLPFSERMETYYEGRLVHNPKLSAKSAWRPPTQGLRDWRTQMGVDDLELFEALAGSTLSELGYELACPKLSPAVRSRARRCEEWWEQQRDKQKLKPADRLNPETFDQPTELHE